MVGSKFFKPIWLKLQPFPRLPHDGRQSNSVVLLAGLLFLYLLNIMFQVINIFHLLWCTCIITEITEALRDLVPFVQFKKREEHPLRSVTFLKLYKWYQTAHSVS